MREYGKVAPSFWTGSTGRTLRKLPDVQRVAMYLITSPHANMLGAYHCPPIYIAHEVGCSLEGACKALAMLQQEGFLTWDESTDYVWVREMARWQIAEALKPGDKRVINIVAEFEKLPQGPIRAGFFQRYRAPFHLPDRLAPSQGASHGASDAPCKPGAGAGAGEGSGAGEETLPGLDAPLPPKSSRGGSPVWETYSSGYRARYGAAPTRDASANSICASLARSLPESDAVSITRHYLSSEDRLYVQRGHPLDLLMRDRQKLLTEVKTGRRVQTSGQPGDKMGTLRRDEVT